MERGIGTEKGEASAGSQLRTCARMRAGGFPAEKERASGSRGLGSRLFDSGVPLEP